MLPAHGMSAIYGRGIWSRIVDRRMGVEARPQEQGVFAVRNLDLVDPLIQLRHLFNLKQRAKQVKLLMVAFSEVQENDTRRSVRLSRIEQVVKGALDNGRDFVRKGART